MNSCFTNFTKCDCDKLVDVEEEEGHSEVQGVLRVSFFFLHRETNLVEAEPRAQSGDPLLKHTATSQAGFSNVAISIEQL